MADATAQLGLALRYASRCEEAVSMLEKASRLNPFPPTWYFNGLSGAYYCTGRYEEAIVACKKALHIQPRNFNAYEQLSAIYVALGQEEKARAAAAEVIRLNPKFSVEQRFKSSLWKNREVKQRYYDALRKAGLPE